MDLSALPPIAAILHLAYSGLLGLTTLLQPVAGAFAAAAAVVLVTLVVRAALIPVGIAQAKAEQTRARLAPRLRDLQKRHGSDPQRLQRETLQLYRDENTSPFAGLRPILFQVPVVGVLYAVFLHTRISGAPNALLAHTLLGVPLGTSFAGAIGSATADASAWVVFAGLILLLAAVGEVTRRVFRISGSASAGPNLPGWSTRLLGLLQFATAVVAIFVPLAAGLYLAVTVTWTLVQRVVLRRRYPLPPVGS
jgi:YidC/Oxa1 family membrane protein insertase